MTVKSLRNKILVILILFTLLFTNCGFTIQAIATSDEFRVIAKGLFQKDEMKFKAYFVDSEGKETSEIINDVSKPANLVLEITPQVEGVLKSGLIRLVPFEEGELNFRLTGSVEDQVEKLKSTLNEQAEKEEAEDTTEENVEAETEVTEKVESPSVESTEAEEKTDSEVSTNSMLEEVGSALKSAITKNTETEKDENQEESSTSSLKSVLNKKDQTEETETAEETEETKETEKEEIVDSEKVEEIEEKEADGEEVVETTEPEIEEEFVDEEALAEAKLQEAKLREELENAISDIKVISDNEVQLSYIKEKTKIELEIEYVQGEKLSVKDLMQKFKLQFSGSFINEDLKEIEIGKEEELTVGWKYSKDFTLSSEYSKVSPFEVGEVTGTIVENRIVVSRKEEGKFLPVKSLNIEITVPTLEGERPTNIEVNAIKLMATRGEDIGLVNFNSENWTYDEESGKIIITVNNLDENGYAINSVGEDEFVVIYRYEKYIEEEPNLLKRVKASLEEYSSPENNILTKEISNKQQEIKIDAGEIVTYNVTTSDDKINKAKIYANYNSDEAVYETEFKTQVSVNILTSDVLETLKIDCSKDTYKDIENTMFDARDIKVKQIKFNYSEIISLLENGGDITIMNKNGETLNILRRELITSEDDVILNLNNSEGLIVAVNNIKSNGIMNFEVTKVILKSSYDKSAYKNFKELESITSAEIKYTELEETVELEETKVSKKFEEAMTIANIVLNKETLSTIKSNEDVELKIELNNDKEYSDLYVNPSFEIVFPKYVKEVSVQSVNILYEEGLRVDDFKTYKEDDIVKIKLDLKGTQTKFVDSEFTNGTNIILNLNIEVDDYTPAKEDQIKLYYCNEGVTSYQTQTKWSIGKAIPNGILKTSNGFDVALINYQAPTGLVTANGIINYDGKLSEVTSVRQGPETRQINRNEPARIATMELLALNNTGNDCTDVLLLGRVPFKGNEDVVSHDDMGTTVSTKMLDELKANIENKNLTKIYYSTNEDAIAD